MPHLRRRCGCPSCEGLKAASATLRRVPVGVASVATLQRGQLKNKLLGPLQYSACDP